MSAARIIGVLLLFTLAAGCAGVAEAPPGVAAQAEPEPAEVGPNAEGPIPAARPPPESQEEARAALAPAEARQPLKAAVPSATTPAKISTAPVTLPQPRRIEAAVPAARDVEPPLDVAALKARLRDTNAIGVFTKLALKNQVDDLMKEFRAHYLNGQKTGVASLRQPYDMLVLKVLSLIQDSDPSLARTISGSREAIWSILADREKFNAAN